jgi:predicted NAD/FAD-dependent oxidoreductase
VTERVAVIGAGLSGLVAAGRLQDAGREVVVYDKGRRPGGRANTREHGTHRFDHGAQFFTVRDERVRPLLEGWLSEGLVEEWRGDLVRIEGTSREPARAAARYVGVPGMVDVALSLAGELDVQKGVRIERLEREGEGWHLIDAESNRRGSFDRVVVAVPAPQAAPLLRGSPALEAAAARVEMAPCWAAMIVFDGSVEIGFDGAFVADGPISWLARDGSKPGRPQAESWVVHASSDWTRKHWDAGRDSVPGLLMEVLEARFGPLPDVEFARAHRWGFAFAGHGTPGHMMYDRGRGLGACGDWCVGGRVEGAIVSGLEVAGDVLQSDALAARSR